MRENWSACARIGAATLPPNIAVAGQPCTLEMTARKDRHHDRHKSPNRCCGWVLECTLAWLSRFRRLTVRYERQAHLPMAGAVSGVASTAGHCPRVEWFFLGVLAPAPRG